jgi:stage IV sporulation protein FB
MRDPFSWAFPLGSLFGILIKVHVLLPLVMLGLVLQTTKDSFYPGTWIDASMLMGLLFVTVFVHEMGHCFAARRVEGEASEVLLWPLGGLARVEVPHTPRANFITAMGGPLANLVICITCGLAMGFILEPHFRPPLSPLWYPYRMDAAGHIELYTWSSETAVVTDNLGALILSRLFWISWITFLLNVLLIGLPLDGGRMLQCVLWPYVGYRQATLYAIFSGFGVMFVVIVAAIYLNDV